MTTALGVIAGEAGRVDLSFHPHPSVWLVIGAVATFFWWASTRLRVRLGAPGLTSHQRRWLVTGCLSLWIFAEYPIHDVAEQYLFLVHMIQHTVFTLIAPACLLMGTPDWLQRWILGHRPIAFLARIFTKPIVALVIFNTLIAVTHWPKLVEKGLHNELIHFSIHLTLFTAALCMWFPVINRQEGFPRLSTPAKMMYLFAQSIVPTVPASFLTFSNRPLYRTYELAPRILHGFSAISDQQIAAAIMKIGAGSLLWAIIGGLFFQWWKDSQAGHAGDNRRVPKPRPVVTFAQAKAEFAASKPPDPPLPRP